MEMLLLRKVSLPHETYLGVLKSCVEKLREYFSHYDDMPHHELRNVVANVVMKAIYEDNVFENPLREGQYVAYANHFGLPVWYILSMNDKDNVPGDIVVITTMMHSKKYAQELEEVHAA